MTHLAVDTTLPASAGMGAVVSAKGLMTVYTDETLHTVNKSGRLESHVSRAVTDLRTGERTRERTTTTLLARGITRPRAVAVGAHVYVLDGSTLRRYTTTARGTRQTGARTGYSTYRALTLVRSEKGRDVLLATTTRGALVTITAPTGTFTPRVATLRSSGWGAIDALATNGCGTTTGLLAISTRTGAVQSLTMAPLAARAGRTTITARGTFSTRHPASLALPSRFTDAT